MDWKGFSSILIRFMINALYDYRQYRYSLYFPLPKLFGKIEKSAALSLMNAVDKFRGPCIHMMIPFRDSHAKEHYSSGKSYQEIP